MANESLDKNKHPRFVGCFILAAYSIPNLCHASFLRVICPLKGEGALAGAQFSGYLNKLWWSHALTSWIHCLWTKNPSVTSDYSSTEKSCITSLGKWVKKMPVAWLRFKVKKAGQSLCHDHRICFLILILPCIMILGFQMSRFPTMFNQDIVGEFLDNYGDF